MVEIIIAAGAIATALLAIITLWVKVSNPLKRWRECFIETSKCLIRSEILSIYYKNQEKCEIKQYEFENLALLYKQYKVLNGNSFADYIWEEVQGWKVIKN